MDLLVIPGCLQFHRRRTRNRCCSRQRSNWIPGSARRAKVTGSRLSPGWRMMELIRGCLIAPRTART